MSKVQTVSYTQIVGMVFRLYRQRARERQIVVAVAVQVGPPNWSRIESGHISLSVIQLDIAAEQVGEWPSEILDRTERVRERLKGAQEPLKIVPKMSGECVGRAELYALLQRYASDLLVLPPLSE